MERESSKTRRYLNRIRQFRMEMDLTQRELAAIMEYQSTSFLSHMEAGLSLPLLRTVFKLEAAFQRPISDIYPRLSDSVREPVAKRRVAHFEKRRINALSPINTEEQSSIPADNCIRQLRMEKGYTQRALAFIMGYESVSSLSHMEAGRKLPCLKTVFALEAALQRPIRDIFPALFDAV